MYNTFANYCIFSMLCAALFSTQELNAQDVRDPTAPLGHVASANAASGENWVLDAVLVSPGRKLAVINGNTVREGQTIPGSNGTKVQRILAQTVVLQQDSQTRVLTLSPGVVKKNSSIKQNN
ncbi:hypothetical protein [Cellvibrio sp. pealriver]|uniref:hypothetical protein n=1 Tax=Cellvibrio sp. pealriver TaxID=1622269 RepID=UPI00066FBFBF|nr:hypothetical protein [Cellvibrio sp. pealriver]